MGSRCMGAGMAEKNLLRQAVDGTLLNWLTDALAVLGGMGCLTFVAAAAGAYFLWPGTTATLLLVLAVVAFIVGVAAGAGCGKLQKFQEELPTKEELEAAAEMALKGRDLVKDVAGKAREALGEIVSPTKGSIRTKVSGVTFANPDGTDRQEIIRRYCRAGEELLLRPEPDNEHDDLAISVWVRTSPKTKARWRQVGYINADLVEDVHALYDTGNAVFSRILQVTEGGAKRTLGVNIEIYVG